MLVRGKSQRRIGIRNAADDQAAVVAPSESDPLGGLVLVSKNTSGLECLIVIDPEDSVYQRCSLRDQSARFRRKIPGACMAEGPVRLEAAQVGRADPPRHSIQF